jgi:hypothetical protein
MAHSARFLLREPGLFLSMVALKGGFDLAFSVAHHVMLRPLLADVEAGLGVALSLVLPLSLLAIVATVLFSLFRAVVHALFYREMVRRERRAEAAEAQRTPEP